MRNKIPTYEKDPDLTHKLIFANTKNELYDLARKTITKFDTYYDELTNSSFFFISNSQLVEMLASVNILSSVFCYIVYTYLEEGEEQKAKNMFVTFCSRYSKKTEELLANMKTFNNFPATNDKYKDLQNAILKSLKTLSCLIYYSKRFKLTEAHAYYFNVYFRYLNIITKRITAMTNTNKQLPLKITTFYNTLIPNCVYYFLWGMMPFKRCVLLLKFQALRYNAIDDSDRADYEFINQYKAYYNLGLIYYSNDEVEKAVEILNEAIGVCDGLIRLNNKKKNDKGVELKAIEMKLTVHVLLAEIHTESRNNYNARGEIECFCNLSEQLEAFENEGRYDKQKCQKEKRIIMFCLNEIELRVSNKGIEKPVIKQNYHRAEKASKNPSSIYLDFEVEEIEKFLLFLSSLSMLQIKVLNDTQPMINNSKALPICFSNQFTDCLSFTQRMTLLNIKVMQLHRFLILKNPDRMITLDNFNYELIALEDKNMININEPRGSMSRRPSRVSKDFNQCNEEFEYFLGLFNDKAFVNKNRVSLYALFKSMSKKKVKDYMLNPDLVKELISLYKKENYNNDSTIASRNNTSSNTMKQTEITTSKDPHKTETIDVCKKTDESMDDNTSSL